MILLDGEKFLSQFEVDKQILKSQYGLYQPGTEVVVESNACDDGRNFGPAYEMRITDGGQPVAALRLLEFIRRRDFEFSPFFSDWVFNDILNAGILEPDIAVLTNKIEVADLYKGRGLGNLLTRVKPAFARSIWGEKELLYANMLMPEGQSRLIQNWDRAFNKGILPAGNAFLYLNPLTDKSFSLPGCLEFKFAPLRRLEVMFTKSELQRAITASILYSPVQMGIEINALSEKVFSQYAQHLMFIN